MSNAETIRRLFPELEEIKNKKLTEKVIRTWVRVCREAGIGSKLETFPFYHEVPQESLVGHVKKVVKVIKAVVSSLEDLPDIPKLDKDVLLATGLLHDVDKLLLYRPKKGRKGWEPSPTAKKFPHGGLGAMYCREEGLPEVVVHLVATHALDSPLPPEPYEGVILHYADYLVADTALWQAGKPLLLRH
jgi:putative nucleotidyltransferase with HDIG domain